MPRDIDAPAHPDAIMPGDVVEETLQPNETPRTAEPDQLTDGYRYARLVFTPSGTASATLVGIHAVLSGARFAGNVMLSAT